MKADKPTKGQTEPLEDDFEIEPALPSAKVPDRETLLALAERYSSFKGLAWSQEMLAGIGDRFSELSDAVLGRIIGAVIQSGA